MTPLTEEILRYKRTGANRDILIEKIAVDLYAYPKRKLGWDEDACSEYFCYFFPKISGMIDRFLYQGKPFEAFMFVTLKWQLKTYATRKSIETRKRKLLINNEFWDNYNRGEYYAAEPDYNLTPRAKEFLNVSEDGLIRDSTSRRRILFLTMKGAFFIPDHLVEHISILTGYNREWLYSCLEKLRTQMKTRDSRLKILKIRRNKIFGNAQPFFKVALDRDIDNVPAWVSHQTPDPGQLTDLLNVSASAGESHHVNRIKLVKPVQHGLGDFFGDRSPDIQGPDKFFFVGNLSVPEHFFQMAGLFRSFSDNFLFLFGYDQVFK